MKHFKSPRFWKEYKKTRILGIIIVSIFTIPAIFLGIIAFFGEAPRIYILAIICFTPALLFFLLFYISEKRVKRIINSLSLEEAKLISSEIESDKTIYYKKSKLCLTEHYIVILRNLNIIKYTDIIWMYNIGINYGFQGERQLQVYTKNHETYPIFTSPLGKKQETNLEIMNFIFQKNSNIMKGYTPENIKIMEKAKEEYKKSL